MWLDRGAVNDEGREQPTQRKDQRIDEGILQDICHLALAAAGDKGADHCTQESPDNYDHSLPVGLSRLVP